MWSNRRDNHGFSVDPPGDYDFNDDVPNDVLDNWAFRRRTFPGPFQFVLCATGRIRAYDLDPDISLRDLFARDREAIARVRIDDGI